MTRWLRLVPLIAALLVAAVPLVRHLRRVDAETAGVAFLKRLDEAQQAFRQGAGHGAYATAVVSLTSGCEGGAALLPAADVVRLADLGFALALRAADGAAAMATDCQGTPTASDYYAGLQPAAPEARPQQAYAVTGSVRRIYVFFDGVAPLERDMAAGGLATPLDTLTAMRIP